MNDLRCEYHNIYYHENDKTSLSLLEDYYKTVFTEAFPKSDTRELLENMIDYLKKKKNGWYGKNNYHIIVGKTEESIVSGAICDYFAETNTGALEYIAVNYLKRGRGYAREIFLKAVDTLKKDAIKAGYSDLDWVIGEIEHPAKLMENADKSYLYAWDKVGFRVVDWPHYIQPAISKKNDDVDTLMLIAYKPQGYSSNDEMNVIKPSIIEGFIKDYARFALRIEKPESNSAVCKMLSQLSALDQPIKLLPFVDII